MSDPDLPSTPAPSIWRRSPLVRCLRWIFSPRNARRLLILAAAAAVLVALFYAEEDWRGQRAWTHYRRQLEARGEQLDWSGLLPQPVPDDQNFAGTPLVRSWFPKSSPRDLSSRWGKEYSRAREFLRVPADKGYRHLVDLAGWEAALAATQTGQTVREKGKLEPGPADRESRAKAARGLLLWARSGEAEMTELREASQRPYARYPIQYDMENPWAILLPHLANVRAACERLQLQACAELAADQPERALEDLRLMLYLVDSLREEPIVISYLIRVACLQLAVQPIWEGLSDHRWSETQLQEIQARLEEYDFLSDLKRPLEGERAAALLTADLISRKQILGQLLGPDTSGQAAGISSVWTVNALSRIVPSGWYALEKIRYCRLHDAQLTGAFDLAARTVSPAAVTTNARNLDEDLSAVRQRGRVPALLRHELLASLLLPAWSHLTAKAAAAQTTTQEAALACALERYRLAQGQFPEQLEALAPRFAAALPHDVITGKPYQYHRQASGFVLYSVGWNERDDGGVPGKVLFDEAKGDWVWQDQPM